MKTPTAPCGRIFVRTVGTHKDEILTASGIKFYQDTTFRPEWHVIVSGEVVSVPNRIGDQFENKDIVPEVEVGDKLYFEWAVIHNEENRVEIDGEVLWMVDYFHAICAVRNGCMLPIGGRAIVEPYELNRGDKISGTTLYLPEMMKSEIRKDLGYLRAIGKPRLNQTITDAKPGDLVCFPDWSTNPHEIEGKEYYIVDQDYILGKFML